MINMCGYAWLTLYGAINTKMFIPAVKVAVLTRPLDPSVLVPGRGGGGGQHRCAFANIGRQHGVVHGLLVSLASSGLKVGRSLAKVQSELDSRFQVSSLPIGVPEVILAAK